MKIWDELNGSEDDAIEVEGDPELALIKAAEDDSDGLCEGLYVMQGGEPNPQPFIVITDDGHRQRWEVYGEITVVFHARLLNESVPREEGT